jgi:hypothetical protein
MTRVITLFIASFLVTAIFSSSLKVFFADVSWNEVLTKGLLIPCFTWSVQLVASFVLLSRDRRLVYWTQLGWVCLIGSFALLPAAFHNFSSSQPLVIISVVNVLSSVVLMFVVLSYRLRHRGFHFGWAFSFLLVIAINMSLYLYSVL